MELAQPGDPDLDIDIDGMTIAAVVSEGREVLVRFTGGFGQWISTTGERSEFRPGEPNEGVEDGDIRMLLLDMTDEGFAFFIDRLTGWRDQALPLRLCGAPGRMFTLIESHVCWLPLPRNPRPDWADA